MAKGHKEAKRLAKSVKRRRSFAEQLRAEAASVRAVAQTLDVGPCNIETAFAERLDAIADREFAAAREEEKQHLEAAERLVRAFSPVPVDPDAEVRQERALAVLNERGSVARIRYMADLFIGLDVKETPSDLLKALEDLLDREAMDNPTNRVGLKFGARISRAESILFTKPRF
ncbi:hypothetical protein [Sphingomonas sp. 3-13AW]|uniref:hypothetical protein n=1 Tax=Sphingomonas sp. 3-13AW TaxID=3050450 RepID=UPI003BB54FC9